MNKAETGSSVCFWAYLRWLIVMTIMIQLLF